MEDTQKKTIAIVLVVAVASVGLYIGYNLWDKANKEDIPSQILMIILQR